MSTLTTAEERAERRDRKERRDLLRKLGEARRDVKPIEKTGHNAEDDFNFVEAVKVVEEANRVLAGRGILILPSVESAQSKFLSAGVLTKVEITFEVVDTYTGYSFEKGGIGHGFDRQGDRAIYKATTGATKYFLAGLLSIPFVGRDPEHDGEAAAAVESAEAERIRKEQDAAAERPDIKPVPDSDLPEPEWERVANA